jgi:hypothetical protein
MFEGFFFVFSAFKENVIEGDGPKNQTQFLSIGNSRWPPPQDIVYIGPYGKTSELTNPPTVVLTQYVGLQLLSCQVHPTHEKQKS